MTENLNPRENQGLSRGLPKGLPKSPVPRTNLLRAKTLIRSAFFAVLCIALLAGNFFWEQASGKYDAEYVVDIGVEADVMKIPGFAYFSGEGLDQVVTPSGTPSGTSSSDGSNKNNIFNINAGRVWGNFEVSSVKANLRVGDNVVIIPVFSSFDLRVEADENGDVVTASLSNYAGVTYVGFLSDVEREVRYLDEYDQTFSNVLLVPAGVKVKIPLSKVDERLEQLLPLKLAKEFLYGFIPEADYEEGVIDDNLSNGKKFVNSLKEMRREELAREFEAMGLGSSVLNWFSEKFAVFQDKREEYAVKKLDVSVYSALESGDTSELAVLSDDVPYYSDFLKTWIEKLRVFDSADDEFEVLSFMLDEAEKEMKGDDKGLINLLALRASGYDFDREVEVAYISTYGVVERLMGNVGDASLYKSFLTYYNQIFNNLLLKNPELYKSDYLEMKGRLESELFNLYYGGQLKEEVKQGFVSDKITLLKRLKYFFFGGADGGDEIELRDAQKVMKYLVESIDKYMPAKTTQNAVVGLFEKELSGVGDFWGYINSAEYSKSVLYGGTHKERYEVYLEEKDQVTSILDVQRDILGSDVIVTVKPSDVIVEIKKIFDGIGATGVEVEELPDVHKRFVKVAAILKGYAFDAEYDRDYGYVRNIYAYGDKLTENSVKLGSLEAFLVSELAEVVEEASGEEGQDLETNAQKIAKAIIAKEISGAGFIASLNDVDILDSVNAVYRVDDVVVEGASGMKISFDYLANDGTVKNIFVLKDGEGASMSGEFPLEDLKEIVTSEHY